MKRVMCVTAGFYSKVIAEIPYALNVHITCKNESKKILDMKSSACLSVRDSLTLQ